MPTSSFGEFRGGHFHGGLDLSTQQVVGYPVHAVSDGEVARVRASGGGYGRALYLRLDDGRLAVYGHLDGFADDLAEWVAAAQESSGRYELDRVPPAGRFRFRRGDVVAWSGESGAGPPHLHFEIREGETGINPQLVGFAVSDVVPPELTALWAYPAAAHARVNEGVDPVRLGARRIAGGYGATSRLRVRGPVRIAVQARDRTQLRPNALGIFSMTTTLAGERVYASALDSASWLAATEVEAVYDPVVRARGATDALALTPASGLRDSVVRVGTPSWERPPGVYPLVVEARDVAGNRTRLECEIEWLAPDTAAASSASASRGGGGLSIEVGLGRLTARTAPGLRLRVEPPLEEAGPQPLEYERTWAVPANFDAPVRVLAVRGGAGSEAIAGDRRLRVAEIRPGWSQVIRSPDERFAIAVDGESAFEPQVVAVQESDVMPSGGAPFGRVYHVMPEWLALRAAVELSIVPPDSVEREGLGLFESGSTGDLVGGMDSSGTRLAGTTRRFGSFTARYDLVPPTIGGPRVRSARAGSGGARGTRFSITWSLLDAGAGVSPSGIVVEMDGRPVPVEYDLESAALVWRPRVRPVSGRHSYRIEARDRLGAHALRTGEVRVP